MIEIDSDPTRKVAMATTRPIAQAHPGPPDAYQVLILRLWRESDAPAAESPAWRWSVEDPRGGSRRGFASLDALAVFLEELTAAPPARPKGD